MYRKTIKTIFSIVVISFSSLSASYITVCKSCHGKNFEKRALGKSRIVKNLKKEEIVKRLRYFKTSNSTMKSFASPLSDKQINQIANVFGQ